VTPAIAKGFSIKQLVQEGLEPSDYWDDWTDYRDSFRNKPKKRDDA
jgi:hypothetical protein